MLIVCRSRKEEEGAHYRCVARTSKDADVDHRDHLGAVSDALWRQRCLHLEWETGGSLNTYLRKHMISYLVFIVLKKIYNNP